MKNKNIIEVEEIKKTPEVKLKSEQYNNYSNELIEKREENSDAIMWGFVIGFLLFLILMVCIIIFTN